MQEAPASPPPHGELDRLALKYGSDKATVRVGPLVPKGYTTYYERHLAPLRHAPITLLEIGIWKGASLRMWAEYFPNAKIVGIDSDASCLGMQDGRTSVYVGDQSDRDFLRKVVESVGSPFDVIIDDGGHRMEQQITSVQELFPTMARGGLYAIEDLHTSYTARYGGGKLGAGNTASTLLSSVHHLHARPELVGPPGLQRRAGDAPPLDREVLMRLKSVSFYPSLAVLEAT